MVNGIKEKQFIDIINKLGKCNRCTRLKCCQK